VDYLNLDINSLRERLDNSEINEKELFNLAVEKAQNKNSEYNNFVTILNNYEGESNKDSVLNGIPYALKDNFSTKNILTTASSNLLKDYVPIYDATVYKKLKEKGALLVGKTVMDEFAMGGTGTTGHTGKVCNAWDRSRMIGGSSSGSANSVAQGIVPFAIGSDTGDSVRKPASYGGVVGFKPTYGKISRYGLFAFASSLDHVGIFTRNVFDSATIFDVLKGHDDNDMTSLEDDNINCVSSLDNDIKAKKLFYIKEMLDIDTSDSELKSIIDNFKEVIEKCKNLGFVVDEISIDKKLLSAISPCYNTISCAEATSNLANLTGVSFGNRTDVDNINEMIKDTRTKGFSPLIKRRLIIGSYVLQKENQEKLFFNATRIRKMIVDKFNLLFKEYDAYILPTTGSVAPKFDFKDDKLSDKYLLLENHLIIGNFGGYPSISIPCGFVNKMPIGLSITSASFKDDLVLNIAYKIEQILGYKNLIAKDKDLDV